MDRRSFFRTMIGGLATAAAVRIFPSAKASGAIQSHYHLEGSIVTDDLLRKAEGAQMMRASGQRWVTEIAHPLLIPVLMLTPMDGEHFAPHGEVSSCLCDCRVMFVPRDFFSPAELALMRREKKEGGIGHVFDRDGEMVLVSYTG